MRGKKADIGRKQRPSNAPFAQARSNFPPRFGCWRIAAEYLFNRVYLFARSARFVKITRNRVVRGIWRRLSRAAAVQFHSVARGRGALVGRGCCRECGRICIIVRTNFELCQKDLVGSSRAVCVYANVAGCGSSFADSEFHPNELFMYAAILKRGCNFQPFHSVFAFRPMKCFILIRTCGLNVCVTV